MQLISTRKDKMVSDSVFDSALAKLVEVDKAEMFCVLDYDLLECGHTLSLPLPAPILGAAKAQFGVRITPQNIHTDLLVYDFDDDDRLTEYCNDCGDLEFDVRMSDAEKLDLLNLIARSLIKMKE